MTGEKDLDKKGYEPLLPLEKKLIAWSLIGGVAVLVLFLAGTNIFFTE